MQKFPCYFFFKKMRIFRPLIFLTVLCGTALGEPRFKPDATGFEQRIVPFLDTYCNNCHDADVQKGDVRFDIIDGDLISGKHTELWMDVLHRLETGEMPPEKKKQPSSAERHAVEDWIRHELNKHLTVRMGVPGRVVMRRLTRDEYRHTVKDLLGLPYDIGADLPPDTAYKGFKNVAASQELSPEQLEAYLDLARFALERALPTGPRPLTVQYRIEPEKVKEAGQWRVQTHGLAENESAWKEVASHSRHLQNIKNPAEWQPEPTVLHINHKQNTVQSCTTVDEGVWLAASDGLNTGQFNSWGRLHCAFKAMPFTEHARYTLRVKTGAKKQPKLGNPMLTILCRGKLLGHFPVLADAENPEWLTFDFALRDLKSIALHSRDNRSWRAKNRDIILVNGTEFPGEGGGKRTVKRYKLAEGQELPGIFIDAVEFSCDQYSEWPPPQSADILIESPERNRPELYAKDVLTAFMSRAFRRPVRPHEVETKLALFRRKFEATSDFVTAIREPLVATLVSPQFLFINEDHQFTPDRRRPLNDYEIAARLSYFLWQTMPDSDLTKLAAHDKLRDPKVRKLVVDHMLDRPQSRRFTRAFVNQWLRLDKLDGIMVEDDRWTYSDTFKDVIRQEPAEFFHHLLAENLSLYNLIDSDFALVNERLALHYGLPDVYGTHFRPVALSSDSPRGGLMTQAACLTVTTDGMITSPIYRGIWVMDKILDRKPPEAPANVPPLEDAPTERLSLRDQLARHREDAGCAACHKRIDPVGWPFERFGLLGDYSEMGWGPNWERYSPRHNKKGERPDMHGMMPDGTRVDTVGDLKQVIDQKHRPDVLRSVTRNLLIYALGRPLDLSDRDTVDSILQHLKTNDASARELIYAIVESAPFLEK